MMFGNIPIEKKYNAVCIIAVILGILLLICLFWDRSETQVDSAGTGSSSGDVLILDGKPAPISAELKRFIDEGGYQRIYFVNGKAQIKAVRADSGKEAEVCRINDTGTAVSEECNWDNRNIKFTSSIVFFELVGSPGCPTGSAGGYGFRCR